MNNFLLAEENIQCDPPVEEETLEKLNAQLDAAIKKAEQNVDSEFDKKMGTYCSDVVHDVREFSDRVRHFFDMLNKRIQFPIILVSKIGTR